MEERIEKVGEVRFWNNVLDVYGDVDRPLFLAIEVATLINYNRNLVHQMVKYFVDPDEYLPIQIEWLGQRRKLLTVTETGLFSIIEQSRVPMARAWRRTINDQLVEMRKQKGLNIVEQFEEWNQYFMDNCYYDDETGMHMVTVTIPGGDVDSIPFDEFCEMKGIKIS